MKLETKFIVALTLGSVLATSVSADEVTDWNEIFLQSAIQAQTSPITQTRSAAIFQVAVFDAVNGIERTYSPIHVKPVAPAGASARAAAIQAAYVALVSLYPDQKNTFDTQRTNSLGALAGIETSESIRLGIDWGQTVAESIVGWRAADGITNGLRPYIGGTEPGEWRPTAPAFVPGISIEFSTMTPWVLSSPWQFRPAGPPPLTSLRYAAEFEETKSMGERREFDADCRRDALC